MTGETIIDPEDLRRQIPRVVHALVQRGADFAAAEDAVQQALLRALESWPEHPPRNRTGWLVTVAWRAHLDQVRSDTARVRREELVEDEPRPGEIPSADDTLWLFFLCAHPSLTQASAVALTLRAVGGLTTGQIAEAYLVPEATMAQRISRAKQRLRGMVLDRPGDLRRVLRILYLLFNAGYGGEVDIATESIRLARQLAGMVDHPEADGLLALMLLHQARRPARRTPSGRLVPLAQQDRSLWDEAMIVEGVDTLQRALARDRLGEYQAQAAVAALHADAARVEDTDWVQIVEWYDELLALGDSPLVRLNRAVAVGEEYGGDAGLEELAAVDPSTPRFDAVAGHLHERAGDLHAAERHYTSAVRRASSTAERDHLAREAARVAAAHA